MIDLYKDLTISQFIAALETLNQSINRTPDEIWAAEHIDGSVSQVIFHTLYFTDLYLNAGVEGFRKQPFHVARPDFFRDYEESENRPPRNQYDREGCREYLAFCEDKVRSVIQSETDDVLRGPSLFDWRPGTRAELHIYNMRHVQHHAAQLGLRHQILGGEPLEWVGRG